MQTQGDALGYRRLCRWHINHNDVTRGGNQTNHAVIEVIPIVSIHNIPTGAMHNAPSGRTEIAQGNALGTKVPPPTVQRGAISGGGTPSLWFGRMQSDRLRLPATISLPRLHSMESRKRWIQVFRRLHSSNSACRLGQARCILPTS